MAQYLSFSNMISLIVKMHIANFIVILFIK